MDCFSLCFSKKTAKGASKIEEEVSGINNIRVFSYKELRIATNDFGATNKIGKGGFGSVYKGKLRDGTLVAIKVLSADSTQGIQEFMTEITTISNIEHDNLVKLYGVCAEAAHRILVYNYLENNSLARTLLGSGKCGIQFSWKTRTAICLGVARGLAFLHEGIQPHIVHRDIKASNILLDKHLTPKISDFGIAKIFPPNISHISTRVAGTLGYLAPEYAVRGQLTRKADVYSFGVLLLEIVCGRRNRSSKLPDEQKNLLVWAWELHNRGKLEELMESTLEGKLDMDEARRYIKVCFLCTQQLPKRRPSMSNVVRMLTGEMEFDEKNMPKPGLICELPPSAVMLHNQDDSSSSDSHKTKTKTMTYCPISYSSIYNRTI